MLPVPYLQHFFFLLTSEIMGDELVTAGAELTNIGHRSPLVPGMLFLERAIGLKFPQLPKDFRMGVLPELLNLVG